jgi:hypothetical protein
MPTLKEYQNALNAADVAVVLFAVKNKKIRRGFLRADCRSISTRRFYHTNPSEFKEFYFRKISIMSPVFNAREIMVA